MTQLATLLYASEVKFGRTYVFVAATLALVVSTALAVLAGSFVSKYIPVRALQIVAGLGFVVIGVWTFYSAVRERPSRMAPRPFVELLNLSRPV